MEEKRATLNKSEYKDFTTVPNEVINDASLSFQARFLYIYMLSKPNNWKFYLSNLSKNIGIGFDTIRKYMKELIDFGWVERVEQGHTDGNRFDAVIYKIKFPRRENSVSENFRDGKSNDNNKKENNNKTNNKNKTNENNISIDDDFERFWVTYNKKVGKSAAMRSWRKLSKEDRAAAIAGIKPYQESMRGDMHYIKHPATYLNQRTWEDDFADYNRKSFYDVREDDSERLRNFKKYMREKHPAIEQARNPLSLAGYFELTNNYGVDSVEHELNDIERNISRYKQSDIAYEICKVLDKKRLQV